MDIEAATVLITGAGRGLGRAMALRLADRGARLALVDLDAETLESSAAACRDLGAEARTYIANVADEAAVVASFDAVVEDFGQLDVSIANAGILRDGLLVKGKQGQVESKMTLADWQAVIDVNLTGVFLCGREAAARMVRQQTGGAIINISSISRHGNFGQSNYSAAKAGVAALTVVWAKELARHRIRVNAIAPGFVRTEILDGMKPEALERMTAGIPLGRPGTPEEIAQTVEFLLGNDYMTGRVVDIDGGLRI